tara:strand:- start:23687 stop:24139 length:453 start_codon:yes stop_codon:yes gene_type:complete
MIDIRPCTVNEIEQSPNFDDVIAEYGAESAMPEIGTPKPRMDMYRDIEAAGMLHAVAAFDGLSLVGFMVPIVVTLPHYGVMAATVESFFVAKDRRKNGVGLKMLAFTERHVKERGAKVLLLSAPVASVLDQVMSLSKRYRNSNKVYVVAL